MTNEIKDWRGTAIEVGDVILYAVKHSTSVEVNEAVVREVGFKGEDWRGNPKPFVKVEWVRSSAGLPEWRYIKAVTLTVIRNLTVVEKHTPPAFSVTARTCELGRAEGGLMPTYEFKCRICGNTHEVTRPINSTDDGNPYCCGMAMRRVFSAAGVVFKGSGFYRTDSRPKPPEPKKETPTSD